MTRHSMSQPSPVMTFKIPLEIIQALSSLSLFHTAITKIHVYPPTPSLLKLRVLLPEAQQVLLHLWAPRDPKGDWRNSKEGREFHPLQATLFKEVASLTSNAFCLSQRQL